MDDEEEDNGQGMSKADFLLSCTCHVTIVMVVCGLQDLHGQKAQQIRPCRRPE
jgi:hypothetical protein